MSGLVAVVFSMVALALSGVALVGCVVYAMFIDGGIATSRLRGDVYGLAVVFGMAIVLALVSFNSSIWRRFGVESYNTDEVADSVAVLAVPVMFAVWYFVARGVGAPSVLWKWFAEAVLLFIFQK